MEASNDSSNLASKKGIKWVHRAEKGFVIWENFLKGPGVRHAEGGERKPDYILSDFFKIPHQSVNLFI